jgi:5,10-methylenetetrahydromethanopterin reductase
VSVLADYITRLQAYLGGEAVPFDVEADSMGVVAPSDALELAAGPTAGRLDWLTRADVPKVPVHVAASGPKVIEMAARLADGITFAVGIVPDRLRWAVDTARAARDAAGLPQAAMSLGTYVSVLVHPDRDAAREILAGTAASLARYSVMHGSVSGPADAAMRERLDALHDQYDFNDHFRSGSAQGARLGDTVDAFAIGGPVSYCQDRLAEVVECGIDRISVMSTGGGIDPAGALASREQLVEQVLPALRAISPT